MSSEEIRGKKVSSWSRIWRLLRERESNVITSFNVKLSPELLLKQRRKYWKPRAIAHAALFCEKRAYFPTIEEDINAIHTMPGSRIYVFTDFEDFSPLHHNDTAKWMPRYWEMQMMERCEVFSHHKLTDEDFMKQLFVQRDSESIWLYIMDADSEKCTDKIWRKIALLMTVGRQYNIVVTLASRELELANDSLKCAVSNASYFVVGPAKGIACKDVERLFQIKDASWVKYVEHDNNEQSKFVPVIVGAQNLSDYSFSYKKGILDLRGE